MKSPGMPFPKKTLGLVLAFTLFWILSRRIGTIHPDELMEALKGIHPWRILVALGLTFFDYLIIAGVEVVGLHFFGREGELKRLFPLSLIANALWINGGAVLGGAVKFRLYPRLGLTPLVIGGLMTFSTLTYFLGLFLLGGGLLLTLPGDLVSVAGHLGPWARPLGGLFVLAFIIYLGITLIPRHHIRLGRWDFPLPDPPTAMFQVFLALMDWVVASAVLVVLLPEVAPAMIPLVLACYVLAQITVLLSQVPGGAGVFEATFILLLQHWLSTTQTLGSLLVFRAIFSVIPLIVSGLGYFALEVRWGKKSPRAE